MADQIKSLSPIRPLSVSHHKGDRINYIHLTNEEKRQARERMKTNRGMGESENRPVAHSPCRRFS